jgi:hypothetical protein
MARIVVVSHGVIWPLGVAQIVLIKRLGPMGVKGRVVELVIELAVVFWRLVQKYPIRGHLGLIDVEWLGCLI